MCCRLECSATRAAVLVSFVVTICLFKFRTEFFVRPYKFTNEISFFANRASRGQRRRILSDSNVGGNGTVVLETYCNDAFGILLADSFNDSFYYICEEWLPSIATLNRRLNEDSQSLEDIESPELFIRDTGKEYNTHHQERFLSRSGLRHFPEIFHSSRKAPQLSNSQLGDVAKGSSDSTHGQKFAYDFPYYEWEEGDPAFGLCAVRDPVAKEFVLLWTDTFSSEIKMSWMNETGQERAHQVFALARNCPFLITSVTAPEADGSKNRTFVYWIESTKFSCGPPFQTTIYELFGSNRPPPGMLDRFIYNGTHILTSIQLDDCGDYQPHNLLVFPPSTFYPESLPTSTQSSHLFWVSCGDLIVAYKLIYNPTSEEPKTTPLPKYSTLKTKTDFAKTMSQNHETDYNHLRETPDEVFSSEEHFSDSEADSSRDYGRRGSFFPFKSFVLQNPVGSETPYGTSGQSFVLRQKGDDWQLKLIVTDSNYYMEKDGQYSIFMSNVTDNLMLEQSKSAVVVLCRMSVDFIWSMIPTVLDPVQCEVQFLRALAGHAIDMTLSLETPRYLMAAVHIIGISAFNLSGGEPNLSLQTGQWAVYSDLDGVTGEPYCTLMNPACIEYWPSVANRPKRVFFLDRSDGIVRSLYVNEWSSLVIPNMSVATAANSDKRVAPRSIGFFPKTQRLVGLSWASRKFYKLSKNDTSMDLSLSSFFTSPGRPHQFTVWNPSDSDSDLILWSEPEERRVVGSHDTDFNFGKQIYEGLLGFSVTGLDLSKLTGSVYAAVPKAGLIVGTSIDDILRNLSSTFYLHFATSHYPDDPNTLSLRPHFLVVDAATDAVYMSTLPSSNLSSYNLSQPLDFVAPNEDGYYLRPPADLLYTDTTSVSLGSTVWILRKMMVATSMKQKPIPFYTNDMTIIKTITEDSTWLVISESMVGSPDQFRVSKIPMASAAEAMSETPIPLRTEKDLIVIEDWCTVHSTVVFSAIGEMGLWGGYIHEDSTVYSRAFGYLAISLLGVTLVMSFVTVFFRNDSCSSRRCDQRRESGSAHKTEVGDGF